MECPECKNSYRKGTAMKIQIAGLSLLAVAGLVVGCDEKPSTPAAPSAMDKVTEKVNDAAKDTAKSVTDKAAEVTDAAKDAGAAAADKVQEAGGNALDAAKNMGGDLLGKLGGKPEELLSKAKELIASNNLAEAKTLLEKLKGVQDMLPDAIKKELPELLKKVGL
jgi:hypothetical protein